MAEFKYDTIMIIGYPNATNIHSIDGCRRRLQFILCIVKVYDNALYSGTNLMPKKGGND